MLQLEFVRDSLLFVGIQTKIDFLQDGFLAKVLRKALVIHRRRETPKQREIHQKLHQYRYWATKI